MSALPFCVTEFTVYSGVCIGEVAEMVFRLGTFIILGFVLTIECVMVIATMRMQNGAPWMLRILLCASPVQLLFLMGRDTIFTADAGGVRVITNVWLAAYVHSAMAFQCAVIAIYLHHSFVKENSHKALKMTFTFLGAFHVILYTSGMPLALLYKEFLPEHVAFWVPLLTFACAIAFCIVPALGLFAGDKRNNRQLVLLNMWALFVLLISSLALITTHSTADVILPELAWLALIVFSSVMFADIMVQISRFERQAPEADNDASSEEEAENALYAEEDVSLRTEETDSTSSTSSTDTTVQS